MTFFDSLLMSYVTDKWQKAVTVCSRASISYWDDGIDQTNETFLTARMRVLGESGRLEIRGETARGMLFSEVRLARP